jgi:hypothetical protein
LFVPIWVLGAVFLTGILLGWISRGSDSPGETFIPPQSPAELEARIRGLLAQGQKIQAIRLYREFHHQVDLKHAKETIDAMERNLGLPPT